ARVVGGRFERGIEHLRLEHLIGDVFGPGLDLLLGRERSDVDVVCPPSELRGQLRQGNIHLEVRRGEASGVRDVVLAAVFAEDVSKLEPDRIRLRWSKRGHAETPMTCERSAVLLVGTLPTASKYRSVDRRRCPTRTLGGGGRHGSLRLS